MQIKKIITHGGMFHADEVMAIAMLRHFGFTAEVERKFEISEEEFSSSEILILDIGRRFDPQLGNLDHHQDPTSPATNILVADFLVNKGLLSLEVYQNLLPFLTEVSDVDRGIIPEGGSTSGLNSIIRSMNGAVEFEEATKIMQKIISAKIFVAEKAIQTLQKWRGLEKISTRVKISSDPAELPGWKKLAEGEGVILLISPNTRGGFQVVTRDTEVFRIPSDPRQSFCHNSGFMAVYPQKEDAVAHAMELTSSL
jgi:hypothetical protein